MRQIFLSPRDRTELGRATMMGLNFAVGMAVFASLGWYIDHRRGGDSILFTVCGMVLGLGYGAYEVWVVIRLLNEDAAEAMREKEKAESNKDKL